MPDPTIPTFDNTTVTDVTMPDGSWEFDEAVTEVFDDMLARSIPQYETMRDAVVDLVDALLRPSASRPINILDIGTSNGEMLARLLHRFGDAATYQGTDVSLPMLNAARNRFAGHDLLSRIHIGKHDLREGFPTGTFNAIMACLTIQFVPIEYRVRIIQDAYDALAPGGVLIVVEKVLGAGAILDNTMTDVYLEMKRRNGYPQEAIDRKRLSLEGVLVPITASWNEDLLRTAGFMKVDCFWRWMNFAGWVAVK